MRRIVRAGWVALGLAIAWSGLQAQTQNQIVSVGLTGALFYVPGYPTAAPGQLVTLFTTPLGVPDAIATTTPLPTTLSGVSVLARVIGAEDATGYPTSLPILRIDNRGPVQFPNGAFCPSGPDSAYCSGTRITVEIPTEGVCYEAASFHGAHPCAVQPYVLLPPLLVLNIKANGVTGPDLPLSVQASAPHLLNSCDSIFGTPSTSTCHPLITHVDGTVVSSANPAKAGEALTLYASGLAVDGTLSFLAPTGYPLKAPVLASTGGLTLSYTAASTGPPTSPSSTIEISTQRRILFRVDWAGFIPGFIGLAQVNFTVPSIPDKLNPCSGSYNVALSLTNQTGGTVYMCVEQ